MGTKPDLNSALYQSLDYQFFVLFPLFICQFPGVRFPFQINMQNRPIGMKGIARA